jgi:hypothetical protein
MQIEETSIEEAQLVTKKMIRAVGDDHNELTYCLAILIMVKAARNVAPEKMKIAEKVLEIIPDLEEGADC